MKPIISLVTLLLLTAYAKEHSSPKKYLDGYEAHMLIQQGKDLVCYDKETNQEYHLKKYQFTFPAGGLYFYNVNNEPVSTTKCVVVSK